MINYLMLFLLLISSMLFGGNDSLTCLAVFKGTSNSCGEVRCNGDFNGDGYKDFAISSPYVNANMQAVYVYYGSALVDTIPDKIINRPSVSGVTIASFGEKISLEGDFNGDGYSDMVIGDPYADSQGSFDCGVVLIYYGGANPDSLPGCAMIGSGNGLHYGNRLTVGDYNGDGFSDLAVSGDGPDYYFTGKIAVYYGQANLNAGISWAAGWTKTGQPLEKIGDGMLTANFDGDIYDDLIYSSINGEIAYNKKILHAYNGSSAGFGAEQIWHYGEPNTQFCYNPSPICDFNNDGFDDLFFISEEIDESHLLKIYSGDPLDFLKFQSQTAVLNPVSYCLKINDDSFDDIISRKATTYPPSDGNYIYRVIYGNQNFSLDIQDTIHYMFNYLRYQIGDINNDGYTEFLSRKANSSYYALCSTKPVTNDIDSPGVVTDAAFFTYPNPFNNTTSINYTLPRDNHVNLAVYNTKGETVRNLFNGKQHSGNHTFNFNADGLNSGVYYIRLKSKASVQTTKCLLVK